MFVAVVAVVVLAWASFATSVSAPEHIRQVNVPGATFSTTT